MVAYKVLAGLIMGLPDFDLITGLRDKEIVTAAVIAWGFLFK